jgi:RNA polymerase sigma-70 factor (ECF subfamily)
MLNVFIHPGKRASADFITRHSARALRHGFTADAPPLRFRAVKHVEEPLLKNLNVFVAFARSRLGDAHLAEDAVQDSLVKALASARPPARGEETVAWFYRILRRSIIDLHRRHDARKRALERFEQELPDAPGASDERLLCQCFKRLLPAVPERYRELLQRIDLDGDEVGDVAAELGLTRNNLTVRLHRARKHLREQVARNCRTCSKHGCLDCTCGESAVAVHPH